jgi:exopolysaccharide biosynthesis protein
MRWKRTICLGLSLLVIAELGALTYALVDRYLVGRSEAASVTTTETLAWSSSTDSSESSEDATATSYESVDSTGVSYTATDTSYTSGTKSISIGTVTTGSGSDAITYYVADVLLTSGTDLQAGLASGGRGTAATSDIAAACDAIFAVNGDYFGARDDGIIIRNGVIYRDDGVRAGLALYQDGRMEVYDETTVSADELLADGVWNTISFGPGLLVNGVTPDNISTYEVERNPEHPIQGRDPRTGIGIIDANHFVFVVVDGRQSGYSKGVTMEEFTQIFKELGCTTAYNLDGGGSSVMYFMGKVVNSPWEHDGGQRAISDILFVG